jgi:hypothetical protein
MKLQVCNLKERINDVSSDKVEDKGDYNMHHKIIFTAGVSKFILSTKNLQGINKERESC